MRWFRLWRSIACPELDFLMEHVDGKQLIVARNVRGVLYGAGEFVHAMDNAVHGCDCGLS